MHRRLLPVLFFIFALALSFALPPATILAVPPQQDATPTPEAEEEAEGEAEMDESAAPSLATASATTTLSNQFGRAIVSARGNHFVSDSAPPLGHPAEEINPVEAMLAAQATCGLFVYEAAAQEMEIPLNAAAVTVQGDFDARGLTGAEAVDPYVQEFRVHFDLDGPDADQAAALAEQFTKRCPIYTTLIKAAPIVITTNDEEMGGPSAEGLATGTVTASLSNQPGRAMVNVRNDWLVVDSVPPLNGPNISVNPMDLLLGAQGTCGVFIMEKAALDMGVPFDGASGVVEVDFNPAGMRDGSVDPAIQAMRVNWEVDTDSHEHADILVNEWLNRCPIYNTLVKATDVEISTRLAGEGTALLEIAFSYNVPTDEFQAEISPLAEQFAAVDGLIWKLWALDEENSTFSGLLLFADDASLDAFLESELAATVMSHPALSDFEVTPFAIMAAESTITDSPQR